MRKNRIVIGVICAIIAFMTGLVVYSPTLYRMFCAVTGFAGTVNRAVAQDIAPAQNGEETRKITVLFDANVDSGLDWEFAPEQRRITVSVGKPTKVYYRARNNTGKTVVARAVYNVTPYKAAPYFFKIQCFCFTNERLGPGEEARMPLVFYVDRQMLKEKDMEDVSTITLSYTFYRQEDLPPEKVAAARDLKGGSETLDASLGADGAKAVFDNDAPRQ